MPEAPEAFLSCDWGTSSFRLRRVEADPFRVTAEIRSEEGVSAVRDRIEREGLERDAAFRSVLQRRIEDLFRGSPEVAPPGAVFVSGMAGSSIGWRELRYAVTPFPLDGSTVPWEELEPLVAAGARHRVILLSGLRTDSDVLRGEETEVMGVLADAKHARFRRGSLLVLPGTHSKHVLVEDGAIAGFRTFMTGEVFSVLSSSSILRHSICAGAPLDEEAFQHGVVAARDRGLLGSLFSVRTNQLLHGMKPASNAWYLSGLLTGSEVLDAAERAPAGAPIVLCAGRTLSRSYALSFEALGFSCRLTVIPQDEVEAASARGHAEFSRRFFGGLEP